MGAWGELVVAVVIAVGLAGTVIPLLPGALLVGGAILAWALVERSAVGWVVAAGALAVIVAGQVGKYLLAGRRLKSDGVATSTMLAGAVGGVVGFFTVPFVGLLVGFVGGVYLWELARLRSAAAAWPATKAAMAAWGVSVLVELGTCLVAATMWLAAAVTT